MSATPHAFGRSFCAVEQFARSRVARIITLLLCSAFAVMFLYVGVREWWRQRQLMAHSEPIDVVITHAAVVRSATRDSDPSPGRSTSTTSYTPEVKFTYRVSDMQYESDLLRPNRIVTGSASESGAAEEITPFIVGATVRAWVDPSRPDQAFLLLDRGNGPIVFIVLGVLLPPLDWFLGRYV